MRGLLFLACFAAALTYPAPLRSLLVLCTIPRAPLTLARRSVRLSCLLALRWLLLWLAVLLPPLLQANSKKRKEGGKGTGGKVGGGAGGKEAGEQAAKLAEEQAAKLAEKQARNRHRLILIVSNHCHAYFCDLIFKHIFYIQEQNCAAQAAAAAAAAASQQFWT